MVTATRNRTGLAELAAVLAMLALMVAAPDAGAASTLVVDDDKVQCPNAGNTDLDEAVFEAQSHDAIRICPGDYGVDAGPAAPTTSRCPLNPATTPNGLRINKSLDVRGAGAGLVTVHPTRDLGDGEVRDNDGSVITVCASQPGSTSFQDVTVNISGITVSDGGFNVDAGINFFNAHGSVAGSTVGPFTGPGLNWGVATTNGYSVSPAGAFVRTVTLSGLNVFGYGAGGVLADGAQAATPTTASGVSTTVNITASTIDGTADPARPSQYGVQVNGGARSLIQTSAITDNLASDPRFGVGVLLNEADTINGTTYPALPTAANQYFTRVGNNNLGGNGYAIFNANNTNTDVRLGAPVQIGSPGTNWFGSASGPLVGSPSAGGQEGISGPDSLAASSFMPTSSFFATSPRTIATTPAAVADASPTVEWGSPAAGDSLIAGEPYDLLAIAGDDFGVSSVVVTIDGVPQPSLTTSPYTLAYTPPESLIGDTVTLEVTATDSKDATATATIEVPVIAVPADPGPGPGPGPLAPAIPDVTAPAANPNCAPLRKKLKKAKGAKAKRKLRRKLRSLGC